MMLFRKFAVACLLTLFTDAYRPACRLSTSSFALRAQPGQHSNGVTMSESGLPRRVAIERLAAGATISVLGGTATVAHADETEDLPPPAPPAPPAAPAMTYEEIGVSKNRAGGLLEPYSDITRGWRILKPSTWNQFDQIPGTYDMKWEDLVSLNYQQIILTTSPVKSTTVSVDALGPVEEVGLKLAKTRDAKLLSAKAFTKEGILFYLFDLQGPAVHQLLTLCVFKGKLWKVDASAPETRWAKTGPLYEKVAASFMPKLG